MSTLAHAVTRSIALRWDTFYQSAVFSGIVGDLAHKLKGGYHISIEDQPSTNYSVVRPYDKAPPGTWPRNLAAGIDMSMNPTDMATCSWRLWHVWNDKSDPRRGYINAFNGWFNDGDVAKRYDYYSNVISTTTSDHKWHVHLEIPRMYVVSTEAANAICSVLSGETKQQFLDSLVLGGEEMYAKWGMGLDGSPISHDTMYLQNHMLFLIDPAHPILPEHPLKADGKYGDNTAYWVSVILTGGDGREVNGAGFSDLNKLVTDRQIKLNLEDFDGGSTIEWPLQATINFPGTTITIPATSIKADVVERE